MSLLEDIFLQDEAGEAQELERVIEGYEDDDRPQSPNSDQNEERDDEAEEDKRRVDPTKGKTKRVVKNPRFLLNPARLTGPRGIQVIPDHFKDFKFKGKGHEKEDLDLVLKKLEHWAYRLYPKFEFGDCLKKIETLGKKRPVMVHLRKIRSDQITSDETVVQKDSSEDEMLPAPQEEDEFDKLLQQQIELARSTPMSVKKPTLDTPNVDRSLLMPKAVSSPSINDDQRERMLKNRRMAEEKRLAKLKNNSNISNETEDRHTIETVDEKDAENQNHSLIKKHNRTNIIDSSSDDEEMTVNQSIVVEVYSKNVKNGDNNFDLISMRIGDTDVIPKSPDKDDEIEGMEINYANNKYSDEARKNIENIREDDKYDTAGNNIEEFGTDNVGSAKNIDSPLDKETVQQEAINNIQDTELQKETSITEESPVSNKECVNNDIDKEIMDVDFGDDF